MSDKFQLPRDGLTYTKEILDRCRNLIEKDIWKDLDFSRFRRWVANFITDEERYFCACVLDALIYRSHDQTVALTTQLLQRTIPDLVRLQPPPCGTIDNFIGVLGDPFRDPVCRIVTAVRRDDPPTKSAHIVARLLKRRFAISESWIIKAWEIPDAIAAGVRTFFFVDDFLGTGDQFERFYKAEHIEANPNIYAAYVPLVAHAGGIAYLQKSLPSVFVSCVEKLSDSNSIFNPNARYFEDGTNTPALAQEFYNQLLRNRGINYAGGGFGDLQLAYAFEHAAPDNSLPILWWRNSPKNWTPLFDR